MLEAGDAEGAARILRTSRPDALVLEWALPKRSALSLLQELRREPATARLPVIMLSAKSDIDDRVRALDAGADDYLTKPFSSRELLARIRALLRRAGGLPVPASGPLVLGELRLDLESHRVWLGEREVALGPREFALLRFLTDHPETAFSREQLLERVWSADRAHLERTVDVHISRLRKALSGQTGGAMIKTVRGIGYQLSTVTVEERNQPT